MTTMEIRLSVKKIGNNIMFEIIFPLLAIINCDLNCIQRIEGIDRIQYIDSVWRYMQEKGHLQAPSFYDIDVIEVAPTSILEKYHFKNRKLEKNKYIIICLKKGHHRQLGGGAIYLLVDADTCSVLDFYRTR